MMPELRNITNEMRLKECGLNNTRNQEIERRLDRCV